MSDPMRTRALLRLKGLRDGPTARYGPPPSPGTEQELLALAATLDDEDILALRNTGPGILRWIREHQEGVAPLRTLNPVPSTTLGEVMKAKGWRVEIFWNSGGQWFTARMVDRDGYLVPRGDPLAASGANPDEVFAHLNDAGDPRA